MCVCSAFFYIYFFIILYVNCFGRTMLYMCIYVTFRYHVSAQGVDERMINVHDYYYYEKSSCTLAHSWEERTSFVVVVVVVVVVFSWNKIVTLYDLGLYLLEGCPAERKMVFTFHTEGFVVIRPV